MATAPCRQEAAAGGDQGMGGIAEQTGRPRRARRLRADRSAVDQHRELPGKPVGYNSRQSPGDGLQAPPPLPHVSFGDLAGGVTGFRKFGCRVDLRATPAIVPPDPFADPLEMGVEFGQGVVRVLVGHHGPKCSKTSRLRKASPYTMPR